MCNTWQSSLQNSWFKFGIDAGPSFTRACIARIGACLAKYAVESEFQKGRIAIPSQSTKVGMTLEILQEVPSTAKCITLSTAFYLEFARYKDCLLCNGL